MALDPREGLQEHSQFKGLRNNVPVDRFELGDLSVAQNVDIDDSERVTRRFGHGSAVVSGACKSLWSDGRVAFAVQSETNLVEILPTYATITLRTGLTSGLDMTYVPMAGRVYYSNGAENGVIEGGQSRSWGITPPSDQPVASEVGGVLPAGRYQFAVTYLRADGQESGTPRAGFIDLAAMGGIALSSIPVPADTGITSKAVYFSKCNGETLYRAGLVSVAATTFTYATEASLQIPLMTQHLRPPPAGALIGRFGARLLVATGNELYPSEPYAPELFDLRKVKRFDSRITMLETVDSRAEGTWLGTEDAVVWLRGESPEKWTYDVAADYGVIPGTLAYIEGETLGEGAPKGSAVAFFATTQGLCYGTPDGNLENLTRDRFAYPIQDKGAAIVRRHRGMVQGLVAMRGAEQAANVSS